VIVIIGAAALARPSLCHFSGGARKFSAGALVAVITIELMPDLLFSHRFTAMAAFGAGVSLMMGVRRLARRFGGADGAGAGRAPSPVESALSLLISGALIGGGFVAGFREGLLTLALTAQAVALGLSSIASPGFNGARVRQCGLAALLVCGAAVGASLCTLSVHRVHIWRI
jgi:hypothetical protein